MRKLFTVPLYIRVYENRFVVERLDEDGSEKSFSAAQPFTTERLLIGNFQPVEQCLREAFADMIPSALIRKSPAVVIQPMLMNEGGLCEVEEKVLMEVALGAGAFKVVIHNGDQLSKPEALAKVNAG